MASRDDNSTDKFDSWFISGLFIAAIVIVLGAAITKSVIYYINDGVYDCSIYEDKEYTEMCENNLVRVLNLRKEYNDAIEANDKKLRQQYLGLNQLQRQRNEIEYLHKKIKLNTPEE